MTNDSPEGSIPVRLRVENEEGFQKTVLHERGLLRIGSAPGSDLRLNHHAVAACHLLIMREGSRHAFTDAGTGRGVGLNGQRVLNGYLKHGDVLTFGDGCPYTITFLSESLRASDRQERNLRKLLDASKAINSSLILDEVLDQVMDYIMEVARAAKGFIMLADAAERLKVKVARNIDRAALDSAVIPVSRTVIQQVFESCRSVFVVGEVETGEPVAPSASMMRLHLKTIMCVPIVSNHRPIGVIYVDHHNRVADVTKTDLEILEALADQAAVAIENARLTERMLLAERVSSVGRMVSSMVHDLRAPLTAIRGAAQILKINPTAEKASRMTDIVLGQVDRMTHMTEEVLDFCRGRMSLDVGTRGLAEFVAHIADAVREEMAGRSTRIILDLDDRLLVSIDTGRMERAFRNLLDNAAEAMPEGGVITIRSSVEGDRACVRISDTGRGMSEEARRRAFEPFFTEGKRNGNGLGMAIARKIIEAHGGETEIETTSPSGTEIRITLPMASAPSASVLDAAGAGVTAS